MYAKRRYGFWMTFRWSRWPFIIGALYSLVICLVEYYLDFSIAIPWQPVSVIGIAVAFYLGFKNNSSYDRTWEARKIWGSIVNNSRSFGAAVIAMVKGDNAAEIHKELIYRHIAWLTALRHQLRLSQEWEHTDERINRYISTICEDYHNKLDGELSNYIGQDEITKYSAKANTATQILKTQSVRLQALHDEQRFDAYHHIALHDLIVSFYADQGKSERIKNFPFPRQYASTAIWLTVIFSALLPFSMLDIFDQNNMIFWICPFACGLLIWIYFLMEMIGDYSENPFEGTYNDVPITTIARGIEIDMREMIDDTDIPKPFKPENGFLL